MSVLKQEAKLAVHLLNEFSGGFVMANRPVHARHAAEAARRLAQAITAEEAKQERIRRVLQGMLHRLRETYSREDMQWLEPHEAREAQKELDS